MRPVAGYGQFCPVAKASEIVAERWTPLVLRELMCGSRRFNDLQRGVPLMSRSLLAKRLRELERGGLVERRRALARSGHEYHLTPAGEELRPVIEALGHWAQRWMQSEISERDLDPALLMWDMRRKITIEEAPDRRVVVRFDLVDVLGPRRRWWLLFGEGEAEICMTEPGFEIDLSVTTTLAGLTAYWIGRREWAELVRGGELVLEGPPWMVRSLPRWLGRSGFAGVEHAQRVGRASIGDPG